MINDVTFIIQIEAKDSLIGQTDLFCYSLNKQYSGFRTIVLCESDIKIQQNNVQTVVVPNTTYPTLKEKIKDKSFIGIKRFTYLDEFLSNDNKITNTDLVVVTDPDTAFINKSEFFNSINLITRNIIGVGPEYTVPINTIKYFSEKSGGNDFKLYSSPIASHGSNIKTITKEWLKIWSYYMNDEQLFNVNINKNGQQKSEHGNGYLIEMFPLHIVAKNLGLKIKQMFPSYYDELFHYFHPFKLGENKEWDKRKINWSFDKLQKIEYKSNINQRYINFYKLFNEWVESKQKGGII